VKLKKKPKNNLNISQAVQDFQNSLDDWRGIPLRLVESESEDSDYCANCGSLITKVESEYSELDNVVTIEDNFTCPLCGTKFEILYKITKTAR
jgi:DNA-directed RNA polymerase subunit RPC12/RpoP